VVQVATGRYHSLALTAEGSVYSWGLNDWGQLGRKGQVCVCVCVCVCVRVCACVQLGLERLGTAGQEGAGVCVSVCACVCVVTLLKFGVLKGPG